MEWVSVIVGENADYFFLLVSYIKVQVARVVESKNNDYQKGKLVVGSMGWTTYSVVDPSLTQVLLSAATSTVPKVSLFSGTGWGDCPFSRESSAPAGKHILN